MQKKPFISGNSLAVVIDRPYCHLMGIDRDTLLHFTMEGPRLVIERSSENPPRTIGQPPPAGDSPAGVMRLVRTLDAHGLDRGGFARLSHDGMGLGEFTGLVSLRGAVDGVTLARLRACLRRRETCRESWDATIDAVLAEICDEESPSERGA